MLLLSIGDPDKSRFPGLHTWIRTTWYTANYRNIFLQIYREFAKLERPRVAVLAAGIYLFVIDMRVPSSIFFHCSYRLEKEKKKKKQISQFGHV